MTLVMALALVMIGWLCGNWLMIGSTLGPRVGQKTTTGEFVCASGNRFLMDFFVSTGQVAYKEFHAPLAKKTR